MKLLLLVAFVGACTPSPRAATEDPCHPKPPVRCESDGACTPYHCKSSFCGQSCETSASCVAGFSCNAGACVKTGSCGTCGGDYDCPSGKKCDLGASACR